MSDEQPDGRTRRAWLLPSLQGYDRRWLRLDVVAGIAAGTVVIPQAMAYATIAGLPVEVGLYTCMLPMLVYALLGGSRSLSISTTSTIAILAASALSTLPSTGSRTSLLRDAFTLTTLVGLCLLAMRLFRLGSLVEQISPATMSGVKAGVGLTVAATQLPDPAGRLRRHAGRGLLRQGRRRTQQARRRERSHRLCLGRHRSSCCSCFAESPRRSPAHWSWLPAASCSWL